MRADGSVVTDAQAMDSASVDGSVADAATVRGTLEGSGACNCTVVSAPANGRSASASWAIARDVRGRGDVRAPRATPANRQLTASESRSERLIGPGGG
jgi:hypothetical protein